MEYLLALGKNEKAETLLQKRFFKGEAVGNRIGIMNMSGIPGITSADIVSDSIIREYMVRIGLEEHIDTIMILTGEPKDAGKTKFHFDAAIFEPNAIGPDGLPGSDQSTMCGNGTRLVGAARTLLGVPDKTNVITLKTRSGLLTIECDDDLYTVRMGRLTHRLENLANYVNFETVQLSENGDFFNSPMPEDIAQLFDQFGITVNNWSIGLTSNEKDQTKIDGEPHVVIELNSDLTLEQLNLVAQTVGPQITKRLDLFPHEINTNFVAGVRTEGQRLIFNEVTHERNLGDDPKTSITASCGTGTTVVVGTLLEKLNDPNIRHGTAVCNGGQLNIISSKNTLYLQGPAYVTNGHQIDVAPHEPIVLSNFSIQDVETLAPYQLVTASDMVISAVKAGGKALIDQFGRAYTAWTTHSGELVTLPADYSEMETNLPEDQVFNILDLNGDHKNNSTVIKVSLLEEKLNIEADPVGNKIYFNGKDGNKYYNQPITSDSYDLLRDIMMTTFQFEGPSDELLDLITGIGGIISGTFNEKNEMVGFNTLIPTLDRSTQPNKTGFLLDMIGIDPKYQKLGIGPGSLRAIIYQAKTLGLNEISLTVDPENERAKKPYNDAGFVKTGFIPNLYGNSTDRDVMTLNLK